jgi:excisionase family DNA binding protein
MSQNPNNSDRNERHYTVREVADRYRVEPATVREWIKRKWLRAIKPGRVIRIPDSALIDFDGAH